MNAFETLIRLLDERIKKHGSSALRPQELREMLEAIVVKPKENKLVVTESEWHCPQCDEMRHPDQEPTDVFCNHCGTKCEQIGN